MDNIGHRFRLNFWMLFVLSFANILVNDVSATPESRAAANFLLFSPSIKSNGMGQAGVALTDELGGYYNPAIPAMIAKSHFFGTVNYLGQMKPVPGLASDIDIAYNAFQIGWNSNHWSRVFSNDSSPNTFSYSLAFAYYRMRTNLGVQFLTDSQGNNLGEFRSFGEADNYVFSLGAHYLIDFGIGATFKNISEHLAGLSGTSGPGTGRARDFGIQARLPFIELAEHFRKRKISIANRWHMRFDLSTGVAWNNRGDEIVFADMDQSDPLPAYRRMGWASVFGVSWKNDIIEWDLLRFMSTFEKYTPQVGGTEESGTSDDMKGIEFSFFDILDIRRGKYDDDDGRRHLETKGYTLKSDGIVRFIQILTRQESQKNYWFDFIVNHFSISWTKFKQESDSIYLDTSHTEFQILF